MKYTYDLNSEKKTIVVQTWGDLLKNEVIAMGLEILLIAKELKYNVFFDHRMSKNKLTITDAYFWFSDNYDYIDTNLKLIPTAYISNQEDWQFFSFFECTSYNKGIPIKAFKEENAAWDWFNDISNPVTSH